MKKIAVSMIIISLIIGSYTIFPTIAQTKASNQSADALTVRENGIDLKEPKPTDARFVNEEEKKLLARLVHAEAEGEPFVGKVAVAEVVLNRVEHEKFPDTIEEVIYQENAFEPVQNGSINEPANTESLKAVEEALTEPQEEEALFFFNPDTATSDWIFSREVIKTIGNHSFAI